MSNYNNNYNQNYNGSGYNNNQRRNNNQPQGKKSGCTLKESYYSKARKEHVDSPIMTGWNVSKQRGMISFIASPHKDPKKRETASPNSEVWMVKMQMPAGVEWFLGFYNIQSKKLTIPDLQMVANPNAPSGRTRKGKSVSGYFGTYVRRN